MVFRREGVFRGKGTDVPFPKAKFKSFSFEKITFKNKFYFELTVYNSLGFCSMFCLTNEMLQWIEKYFCESN